MPRKVNRRHASAAEPRNEPVAAGQGPAEENVVHDGSVAEAEEGRNGTVMALSIARVFGWVLFVVRIVVIDTLELLRGHALHDYASFHAAACAIRAGVSPYRPDELLFGSVSCGMGGVYPYLYPPLLAEAMFPLTFFQPWTARLIWHGLIVCALLGSAWLLDRWLRDKPRGDELSAAFAIVMASFWPLRESHMMGQVNTLVLLLLCVWWTKREKTPLAVIALAGAATIKMSPALLLLVPLVEKRWRELAYGVAATAGFILISCALIGRRGLEFLIRVIAGFVPGAQWHGLKLPIDIFGNSSIAAVLMRLGHAADPQRLPRSLALVQTAILVAMLAGFLLRYRKIAADARAAPLIVLMIVAPTFTWEHHLTFAALAVAMVLAVAPMKRWWFIAIGALAVAMMADRLDYFVLPPFKYPRWFIAIARSPKLPSLIAVYLLALFALQKSQAGLNEATRENLP
jgi:alpha-1,2-mannosyltransferase